MVFLCEGILGSIVNIILERLKLVGFLGIRFILLNINEHIFELFRNVVGIAINLCLRSPVLVQKFYSEVVQVFSLVPYLDNLIFSVNKLQENLLQQGKKPANIIDELFNNDDE